MGYGVAVQSERVIGVAQLVAPVTTYVDCTAASDATPLIDVLDAITKLVAEEEEEAEVCIRLTRRDASCRALALPYASTCLCSPNSLRSLEERMEEHLPSP